MRLPIQLTIGAHFLAARRRWRMLRGDALQRYQQQRAQRMVRFAAAHSPFYRAHWSQSDLNDWRTLPAIDKQLMMANFDRFTTRGIAYADAMRVALQAERSRDFRPTLAGLTVGLSSGTSGHRGLFVVSEAEQAAWAGVILARTLPRIRRRGYRVAFFLRSHSNLYAQADGALIRLRYFDLMTPPAEAVAQLNQFAPDIIVAPPSLLLMLAAERDKGALHAAPERLISVAEVLEPQDARQMGDSFHAPVHQIYQCTEGLLAVSCAHGSLHIQEDVVALQLETIGDPGDERFMPVVTDLHRTVQPIIRYWLGDVLQLDPQRCACGSDFRIIRAIEGRADDVCYFESRQGGLRACFPDVLRRAVLLACDGIADYQVFQLRDRSLRVHLDATCFDEAARAVRASVTATLAQYNCLPVSVAIECGLIPVLPGAKRRRVQRLD